MSKKTKSAAQQRFEAQMQEETIAYIMQAENGDLLLKVIMKPLSYHRWYEIGAAVSNPNPKDYPTFDRKTGKSVPNPESELYREALAEAERERLYRRTLASLAALFAPGKTAETTDAEGKVVPGVFMWEEVELPGETDEDKIAFLKNGRWLYTNAIMLAMQNTSRGNLTRVEAIRDSFR